MESASQKRYRQSPQGKAYMRKYQREWARENYNPQKQRNANLKTNRGIDLERFNEMFDEQDGRCAICKKEFIERAGRAIHVDHNHDTGQIRSLLCGNCNLMIGYAKENTDTLENAIAYLNYWLSHA